MIQSSLFTQDYTDADLIPFFSETIKCSMTFPSLVIYNLWNLYAKDLAIVAEDLEELLIKLKTWKTCMEPMGLGVNKTTAMIEGQNSICRFLPRPRKVPLLCMPQRNGQQLRFLQSVLTLGAPKMQWRRGQDHPEHWLYKCRSCLG